MVERLRALLDRPLDPSAARAILVFASAILVGFAGLFLLAAGQPHPPVAQDHPAPAASSPGSATPGKKVEIGGPAQPPSTHPRQDPQDIAGSTAARRAAHALQSHRALQHVPYRDGEVEITLVGARGSKAVLRIDAKSIREARRGWRRFLTRYADSGKAYVPILKASGGGNG